MPFQARCSCGATQTFEDPFAGQLTRCSTCRTTFVARPLHEGSRPPAAAPIDPYDRDRFLIKQKLLTVHEEYDSTDEYGNLRFSAKRPGQWQERTKANIIFGFIIMVVFFASMFLGEYLHDGHKRSNTLYTVIVMTGAVLGCVAGACFYVYYMPLRATYFYTDSSYTRKTMDVPQITRFAFFHVTYTLRDLNRNVLAVIERNYLRSLFRVHWTVRTPDRSRVICIAEEDSLLLAALRRVLLVWLRHIGVPWIGSLTNFVIRSSEGERLGTFNRKLTILDRYVLDLCDDPKRTLDRRVAVALGVLLDTGERR